MVDLVQKSFRECTIDDDESHSQGSRASLTCDLLLAAFSKRIHSKTRIHTRGQSPGFLQGLSPENSLVEHAYTLGDCPRDYYPAPILGNFLRDFQNLFDRLCRSEKKYHGIRISFTFGIDEELSMIRVLTALSLGLICSINAQAALLAKYSFANDLAADAGSVR